jgi:hypothetical protein
MLNLHSSWPWQAGALVWETLWQSLVLEQGGTTGDAPSISIVINAHDHQLNKFTFIYDIHMIPTWEIAR